MKTLNLSTKVKVKLTEVGIEKLKTNWNSDLMLVGVRGPWVQPDFDEDGYWETTLWYLMNQFGECMFPGCADYFEGELLIEYKRELGDVL